jgi:transposase-like protein
MPLIRLAPNGAGSDVQTFECAKCGHTRTIETTSPVSEAAARPAPGDLRPLQ